jgi:predicted ferric reductase
MWAVFANAVLSFLRRRLQARLWRNGHLSLAVVIVIKAVVHAVLIEGAMEAVSKDALWTSVLLTTMKAIFHAYRRQKPRSHARQNSD